MFATPLTLPRPAAFSLSNVAGGSATPSRLTAESIEAMTSEDAARSAAARAGIQSDPCVQAVAGAMLPGRTYKVEWQRKNLLFLLGIEAYFALHP
jgi:hypothetical protein